MEGIVEVVFPAVCGRTQMLVSREQPPGARRFALRHGLAHVLAGHTSAAEHVHALADWSSWEESLADLFALLDIAPAWQLEELRAAGYSAEEVERWLYAEIARWTTGWLPERLRDRVRLRLTFSG